MDNNQFKVKMMDGTEVELLLKQSTSQDLREADIIRAKYYHKALKEDLMLAKKAREFFEKQGIWTKEKDQELKDCEKELSELNFVLTKQRNLPIGKVGDVGKTMFKVARRMQQLRNKMVELKTIFAEMEANTVEGYAENARHNYLLYVRTVYINDGKRFFDSFEDFDAATNSGEATDKYIVAKLANMQYQLELLGSYSEDINNLPENKFLRKFKFLDEKGRLINEQTKLVDDLGRLVNENGYLIDELGNLIDINDRKLDSTGEYIDEPKPFLDNDGNPILDEDYQRELDAHNNKNKVDSKEKT